MTCLGGGLRSVCAYSIILIILFYTTNVHETFLQLQTQNNFAAFSKIYEIDGGLFENMNKQLTKTASYAACLL